MRSVAVIGGGLAGLTCARALHDRGARVSVFDKGRGVGGRTSTRREGAWRFDHGAPRLDLGAVGELRASWERAGVIVPWHPRGADRATWVGVPGASALANHLAAGLAVETSARVVSLARRDGWWLEIERAGLTTTAGPFDVVAITAPIPQVCDLLATTPADALLALLAEATFAPCLVAMLAIEADGQLDELHDVGGPLASAHRFDSRPGRIAAAAELWVAHGSEAWSVAHLEQDPQEAARELADALTTRPRRGDSSARPPLALRAGHVADRQAVRLRRCPTARCRRGWLRRGGRCGNESRRALGAGPGRTNSRVANEKPATSQPA